jgi:catalase
MPHFFETTQAAKRCSGGPLSPPPVSFATLSYYGVNAFKFTDAAGKSGFVR